MPPDQASALRQLVMDAAGRRARYVAVTSGKGGVGKSSVAVNLAVRLAGMGRRVVLLDADLGTANADVLCNVASRVNLAHVVAGRRALSEAMVAAPGGFRLVPGASGLATMADLSAFERARLVQAMQQIDAECDIVLVDTGAGIGPNVLGFTSGVDQVLVVTTPEPPALTDAYALIKSVHRARQDASIAVFVNLVHGEAEARRVFDRVNLVARRFLKTNLTYAGYLPRDEQVVQAAMRRWPFVLGAPQSEASKCIGCLAHKLDRHASEPRGMGLIGRMVNWLAG